MAAADGSELAELIAAAGAAGASPEALQARLAALSRSTLNRRLAELLKSGVIKAVGAGRARRYVSASPLTRADVEAYFEIPWQQRQVAPFSESLLDAEPGMDADKARRCEQIQALAQVIDQRFLANFVIDLSWASSVLEGGTYSALDTEALVQYGQRNPDKPGADAVLVLNHKRAADYLWRHRDLSVANLNAMHALLTDDHGLPELMGSDHFLSTEQRGRPREFEDVNLAASAYIPPYRPGTGFVAKALEKIVSIANELPALQAVLYLMTRIPYLQAYVNGNKRSSRLAANLPLLAQGLLPFSFADVNKAGYIRGMAAFYELGSLHVIEQTVIRGYVRSVIRGSNIPVSLRTRGFDMDAATRGLVDFINTGKRPVDKLALIFLRP